jgi:pimeloyl-ACP methyl ester carboxylesterase
MGRQPRQPLEPGWVLVDGLPLYHRFSDAAGADARALVHVHGFAISGTYMEPTAALLAANHRTYVPDLPGMGRSLRPPQRPDLEGLATSLVHYLDEIGIEQADFVGNSLGCPIIMELAATHRERIDRIVLVSPAGGPNNQPLRRALGQMSLDAMREPPGMWPIASRDYLRFGVPRSLALFAAMTRYPTLERLSVLVMPTLVIAGIRDPLVRHDRIKLLDPLPHVSAVRIPGAHALNYSRPDVLADLIATFLDDGSLRAAAARHPGVEVTRTEEPPLGQDAKLAE